MKASQIEPGMQVYYQQGRGKKLRAEVINQDRDNPARVKLQDLSQHGAKKRKPFWRLASKLTAACVAAIAVLLLPALAFAQGPAVLDPGSDPMAFVNQILAAAHAHNWLLAVPLAALLAIFGLRTFGARVLNVQWFASDQGGACMALAAAVAEAVIAAALLPGPHALAATVIWIVTTLIRNKALYVIVQKAVAGTRFASWLAMIPAPAPDPAAPVVPGGTIPPAAKAGLILVLALGLLVSSPARAQVTYAVGPTIPILTLEPGQTHPVQVAPGVGLQLDLSLQQLTKAIGGKSWDLASLDGMVFGSIINSGGPQQMGALSAALAVCTMSSLVCIGAGKHIVESQGGILAGKDGWFGVLAFTFAIALAPEAPPVGITKGAVGLPRAATLYLGQ